MVFTSQIVKAETNYLDDEVPTQSENTAESTTENATNDTPGEDENISFDVGNSPAQSYVEV